jgi:hypothetical protein
MPEKRLQVVVPAAKPVFLTEAGFFIGGTGGTLNDLLAPVIRGILEKNKARNVNCINPRLLRGACACFVRHFS